MGNHCIVNCNSSIGHDTVLKSFSQIASGVCIGGTGVEIGEGAFIGLNSTIINKPIKIGSLVPLTESIAHKKKNLLKFTKEKYKYK
jgi:UDP-3-O-[3-hydroxymyristoyl] glucosamine N-acyltransferase